MKIRNRLREKLLIGLAVAVPTAAWAQLFCGNSTQRELTRFVPCNSQNVSIQFNPDPITYCGYSPNPFASCRQIEIADSRNETYWGGDDCTTPIIDSTGWTDNGTTSQATTDVFSC